MDTVISQKNCKSCQADFVITEADSEFYQKISVPFPSLCPQCRMQRRLAHRNDRSLYKSTCAHSGQPIITMYNPDLGLKIYEFKIWRSDAWDAKDYGRDFDFSRTFFEQFAELRQEVPRFNLYNTGSENCDYVNHAPRCKDCYLLFGSWFNEACHYGQTLHQCLHCIDNLFLEASELCYENIDCTRNYRSYFCQGSRNVSDSYFCYDCHNVKNCIGCYNLRNKEYHIENQPVSPNAFEELKSKFASRSFLEQYQASFIQQRKEQAIHKFATTLNSENAHGDFIFDSKNAKHCFSIYGCEDVAFTTRCFEQKDTYDYEGGGKGSFVYEAMSNDWAFNSISCSTCENLTNGHYCDLCFSCNDVLGCVGLQRDSYCILNKQYSKEDFEELSKEIITHMHETGEWGEFFPVDISLFAYNETLAQDYFPITEEQAASHGFRWKSPAQTNLSEEHPVPDNINDVSEEILQQSLTCNCCSKKYKIIKSELHFLQAAQLPLPNSCPDCRHTTRMNQRNPRRFWQRSCDSCQNSIESTFDPNGVETVYCEDCYLKQVI